MGTRNSGAITAAVNYYGTVEMLFTVPRDSFLPPPNVDSAVIRIDVQKRYADQTRDLQHFFSMLKHGFSQRRKTLVNALSATMHYEKPVLLEALHAMELPETGTYGEPDHGAAGGAEQPVVRSNCGKSVNFSEIAEKHWTRAGKCGILVKTKRVRWICTRKERFL